MKKIEVLERRKVYRGNVISLYNDTVLLPDGRTAEWDYIDHPGAAAVVPVLPDGRVLMVRQYRSALQRFTLEIPAGKLDPGEDMRTCAARELEEETGYRSEDLTPLITVNTWIAFCNEKVEIYVARNLEKTCQHPDPDEEIEIEAWDPEDLCRLIDDHKMTDSKTVSAILAYHRLLTGG